MSKYPNYEAISGRTVRFVHARRARKLRKRGDEVRFNHWNVGINGIRKPVYVWVK